MRDADRPIDRRFVITPQDHEHRVQLNAESIRSLVLALEHSLPPDDELLSGLRQGTLTKALGVLGEADGMMGGERYTAPVHDALQTDNIPSQLNMFTLGARRSQNPAIQQRVDTAIDRFRAAFDPEEEK